MGGRVRVRVRVRVVIYRSTDLQIYRSDPIFV